MIGMDFTLEGREKAEVQAEHKENEMGDGAHAAALWSEDEVHAQERHLGKAESAASAAA